MDFVKRPSFSSLSLCEKILACVPCLNEIMRTSGYLQVSPEGADTSNENNIISATLNAEEKIDKNNYIIKYHLFAIAAFVLLPCVSILNYGSNSAVFSYYINDGYNVDVYKDKIVVDNNVKSQLDAIGWIAKNNNQYFYNDNAELGMCTSLLQGAAASLCYQHNNVSFSLNATWWLTLALCLVLMIPIVVGEGVVMCKGNTPTLLLAMGSTTNNCKQRKKYHGCIYGLILGLIVAIIVLNSQYNYQYLTADNTAAEHGNIDTDEVYVNLGGTMMSGASTVLFVYSWVFFAFLMLKFILNKFKINEKERTAGISVNEDGDVLLGAKPIKGIELTSKAKLITDPNVLSNKVRALQK